MPSEHLEMEMLDGVAVVKLKQRNLDEANFQAVADQILRLADDAGQYNLTLDLGSVEYIGGRGLTQFLALNKKVRGARGHLTLVNVGPSVYQVFQVTRLNTLLDVHPKEVA